MKKIILAGLCFLAVSPFAAKANTFTATDTIYATVTGIGAPIDPIINTTSNPVAIKWRVTASDFPASWLTAPALGVCDNITCYNNVGDTAVWNASTQTGSFHTNNAIPGNDSSYIELSLNLTGAVSGTHYMSVHLADANSLSNQTVVFVINYQPTAVPNIASSINKVSMFPNPAIQQTNLAFSLQQSSNVQVQIFDELSRVVSNIPSQNMTAGDQHLTINTENFAAGIYLVKLQTENGAITQRLSVVK